MKYLLIGCLLVLYAPLAAQKKSQPRLIRQVIAIDLLPGIGLSGTEPGHRTSVFSLNLLSGYRYANYGLEISLISAANVAETRGIQLAGAGNITGINYSLSPFTQPEGEANLHGLQMAGLVNVVRDYVYGAQISSLYNQTRNLLGLQLSAINRASGFGFGNQTGIYNWVLGSFDGVQLGALINETNGRLVGVQIAPVNIAGLIEGKYTDPDGKLTALQAGVLNMAGDMHGFQVGLVNISKKMRGTQVGLINIRTSGRVPVNKRDGTMIGLLNIGDFHTLGAATGDLFYYNVWFETGTLKNREVRGELSRRWLTTSLEYSFSPISNDGYERQYGWGLHKYYYNRSVTPGMMEKRYLQAAVRLHYLQPEGKGFDTDHLYAGISAGGGYRVADKLNLYVTFRADLNYAWAMPDEEIRLPSWGSDLGDGTLWPGWRLGVSLH